MIHAGVDAGFDHGGAQIVTGLKLPFWGLNFVEFWCWGLIFGDQGGPGPPLDPPLTCTNQCSPSRDEVSDNKQHGHKQPHTPVHDKGKDLSESLT